MSVRLASISTCMVLALSLPLMAHAEGWHLVPATSSEPLSLRLETNGPVAYRFDCTPDQVLITQTGVTELLDIQTNKKVGDEKGSVMTPGATIMALMVKADDSPDFLPAETRPSAVRGWDMTIAIPKRDKVFKRFAKSEMMSLFTTGYTMAVVIGDQDRLVIKDFLQQCGIKY